MPNAPQNLSADAVISKLTTSGLSTRDAALIASAWIYQNIGQMQRTFTFGADFPAVDAACVDTFAQTFFHTDWVDGQDVVQAGASATDEGFNSRLHKVQNDIAALGTQIATIYTCMADLRANLSARLEELAAEMNRIDADLPTRVTTPPPNWPYRFTGVVENANFLGVTQMDNQAVSMWKTDAGTMILPAVTPLAGDPASDPGVRNAAGLASYVTGTDVQAAFGQGPVTAAKLSEKFGKVVLPTGATVSDVVATLPSTAQFANLNDLVTAVGEQQSKAFRSNSGVPEVIAQSLNLTVAGTPFSQAAVDSVSTLSDTQKSALKAAGISTVGALAAADPATIAAAYTKAGVIGVSSGDIAASRATAGIISGIRAARLTQRL